MDAVTDPAAVTEFITRWKGNIGSERANFSRYWTGEILPCRWLSGSSNGIYAVFP